MEVFVKITRKDFVRFNNYVMWRTGLGYKITVPLFLILLAIETITYTSRSGFNGLGLRLIIFIILFPLFFLVFSPLLNIFYSIIPMKKGGILGEHRFQIKDDGIEESTSQNVNLCKWNGIKSIRETNRYLYLFIDTHMAHVLPKRDFESVDEYHQFKVAIHNGMAREAADQ